MTKAELNTIRNIIARLNKQNCGCSNAANADALVGLANAQNIQCVSRIYLDTWVVGALECLLPESRDPRLAESLSR
jgi:hypothetical protein